MPRVCSIGFIANGNKDRQGVCVVHLNTKKVSAPDCQAGTLATAVQGAVAYGRFPTRPAKLHVFAVMEGKHSVERLRGAVLRGSNAGCLLCRYHDNVTRIKVNPTEQWGLLFENLLQRSPKPSFSDVGKPSFSVEV